MSVCTWSAAGLSLFGSLYYSAKLKDELYMPVEG